MRKPLPPTTTKKALFETAQNINAVSNGSISGLAGKHMAAGEKGWLAWLWIISAFVAGWFNSFTAGELAKEDIDFSSSIAFKEWFRRKWLAIKAAFSSWQNFKTSLANLFMPVKRTFTTQEGFKDFIDWLFAAGGNGLGCAAATAASIFALISPSSGTSVIAGLGSASAQAAAVMGIMGFLLIVVVALISSKTQQNWKKGLLTGLAISLVFTAILGSILVSTGMLSAAAIPTLLTVCAIVGLSTFAINYYLSRHQTKKLLSTTINRKIPFYLKAIAFVLAVGDAFALFGLTFISVKGLPIGLAASALGPAGLVIGSLLLLATVPYMYTSIRDVLMRIIETAKGKGEASLLQKMINAGKSFTKLDVVISVIFPPYALGRFFYAYFEQQNGAQKSANVRLLQTMLSVVFLPYGMVAVFYYHYKKKMPTNTPTYKIVSKSVAAAIILPAAIFGVVMSLKQAGLDFSLSM